jgi:hypothetical protein
LDVNELERRIGSKGGKVSRLEHGKTVSVDPDVWSRLAAECKVPLDSLLNDPVGGQTQAPPVALGTEPDPRYANRAIFLSHLSAEGAEVDPVILGGMMATKLSATDAGDIPWWRERYFHLIDERLRTRDLLRERAQRDAGRPLPAPMASDAQRRKKGAAG